MSGKLCSINAQVRTYVRFVNITNRHLNVFWINYEGVSEFQFTMHPKSEHMVNTYLTHPWFFRDKDTGEFMQVGHRNIFLPQYYSIPDSGNLMRRIPCRKQIVIHLPMHSLRYKCLYAVATSIKQKHLVNIDTSQLEIPQTLEIELCIVLKALHKWRNGS